jgi:hypothetical protein
MGRQSPTPNVEWLEAVVLIERYVRHDLQVPRSQPALADAILPVLAVLAVLPVEAIDPRRTPWPLRSRRSWRTLCSAGTRDRFGHAFLDVLHALVKLVHDGAAGHEARCEHGVGGERGNQDSRH